MRLATDTGVVADMRMLLNELLDNKEIYLQHHQHFRHMKNAEIRALFKIPELSFTVTLGRL